MPQADNSAVLTANDDRTFKNLDAGNSPMAPPPLLHLWQIALRWNKIIMAIVAASLVLGLIATLLMTPRYTAKSRIEISRTQKNITNVQGVEAADAGRDQEFYQTQYSLLTARSLAERVARQLRLASNDAFFEAHGVDPTGASFFGSSKTASRDVLARRERQVVDLLLDNVNVAPVRGSALVDIGYTSASPQFSADIANAWTQQYIQLSIDRRFSSTADARKFLENRLTDLRSRLEQSERDLVNYATSRDIVSLSRTRDDAGRTQSERTLAASDLEALNEELAKATADRIAEESRFRASADKDAQRDPMASGALNQLRQRRAEVSGEYARLLVQFEPSYPAAQALSEQIRNLDASIAREEGRLSRRNSAVRADDYQAAQVRESGLRDQVAALKKRYDTQQRSSIQYNIYQREVDTNRQLYDSLLQRYKEIGVSGVAANNISIVDAAQVPQKPSSPKLAVNMFLALLGGLAVALATVFTLDRLAEGLRSPDQVSSVLQIPFLGSVPEIEGSAVEGIGDAKSALYEAYLSVASNLAFSSDHGVPRTILVTSTRPGEGKSTTSLALTKVIERTGKKVLLIDADMRSPSVHSLLELSNDHGLSNYLAGLVTDWRSLVQASSALDVVAIAAGPRPPNAAELLSGDRLSLLFEAILQEFDHIIIDAPPLLGLADAPLLSRTVEGCVFVMQSEGVAIRGLQMGLDRLRTAHARILGGVLSRIKQRQAQYGYGYDYGYGYGHDSAESKER